MPQLKKCYAACFTGQYAWLGSSLGVSATARRMRDAGIAAEVFGYKQIDEAVARIDTFGKLGFLIILFGYSLGVSTATYLQAATAAQRRRPCDLLIAVAGSKLGLNYAIDPQWTRRAVLFTGDGMLSSWESPTFNSIVHVHGTPHLWMDFHPGVVTGTMLEVIQLQAG